MRKGLAGATVVITGASSGIGRAAALAFARRGALLVLGARRELLLGELAVEIQQLGSRALVSALDVADAGSLQHFAHKARETFGSIDVWINNAGVGLFGRLHDAPIDFHHRVITVNLMGTLYGGIAALPYLVESRGVLINNAPAIASTGAPYAAAYAAAAGGIRSLSASLRQEFRSRGVDVCTLMPGAVATPFYEHAANFTGRVARPSTRACQPEAVAQAMIELAEHPRAEVILGTGPAMFDWLHRLIPGLAERAAAEHMERRELDRMAALPEPGNLFEPVHTGKDSHMDPFSISEPRRGGASTRLAAVALGALSAMRSRSA